MSSDHSRALVLQEDLTRLTEKLAVEIGRLPSERDPDEIYALWRQMGTYRPRLMSLYRRLRKTERKSRSQLSRIEYEKQRKILKDTKLLNQRLGKWDWFDRLVSRHAHPVAEPLSLFRTDNQSDKLLELFYAALFQMANPHSQSEEAEEHGCFADIPLSIRGFEQLIRVAYRLLLIQGRLKDARFLDVGCGGGSKVLAASAYFSQCHGMEYDRDYARAGQTMIETTNADTCHVFHGDGLTFDGYDDYDVIYFYRPLYKDDLLEKMEDRVFSNVRRGTVILAPYTAALAPRKDIKYPNLTECVFVAGMDQDETDALHKEAEFTGTDLMISAKDLKFDPGFWSPILDSATYTGNI